MVKNTVREGNLFQVVDCSLTSLFLLPSPSQSQHPWGVGAGDRARGSWGTLRTRPAVRPARDRQTGTERRSHPRLPET